MSKSIEQYTNAGATTTADYFLISRNNSYLKLSQVDFYTEILTAVGSISISIGDLTDVDTTTTPLSVSDTLKWDGTNFVNAKTYTLSTSANYTATLDDEVILVDASAGNRTITLPSASSSSGHAYVIKKVDSSGNSVIIDGDGSETIDGATTVTTTTQWASFNIISNGTNWFKI